MISSTLMMARRLPLGLLALALMAAGSAHAASFDCKKAATAVEKAICADKGLGGLDEQVGESYRKLIDGAPSADVPALRDAQRSWLKQRNQCAPAELDTCLAESMKRRVKVLHTEIASEDVALDRAIAGIPADPAVAARTLRGYAGPLASAWLVYLHQFEPTTGITEEEVKQRRVAALAGLQDDGYAMDVYRDIESKKYSKDGNATLTLLRMLIERAGYENDGHSRPYVHCFVFARQGDAAYKAFGPLYGSSRDGMAPICRPQGDLFERPEWKRLEAAMEPVLGRSSMQTGTIRFGYYADWSMQELRATLTPRDFLKALPKHLAGNAERDIRDWEDDQNWPAKEREAVLAALPPVRHVTAEWLKTQRGFDDADAAKAATGIVQAWLAERVGFAGDSLGGH
jgi:uncharacterized protein